MTNFRLSFPIRARNTIARYGMIAPGDRVLAAVSGGPDSVALLEVLLELGFPVEIAHFDHQTRGGGSRQDAAFVATLSAKHALEYHFESCPVGADAAAAGKSFEQHARDLRYAFFLRVARERGCNVIATGHHADDQVETVLMRLLHGCGPQALAGIPPVRVAGNARIVRPLIECTRPEILAYLAERGAGYSEDASNADVTVPRNQVRHELLPLLERGYNPRVREAILRLAEQQHILNAFLRRHEDAAIENCFDAEGAIRRGPFGALDEALRNRVALHVARSYGVRPDAARVAALTEFLSHAPAGRRFDLGNGIVLHNSRELTEAIPPVEADVIPGVALHVPGSVQYRDWLFTAHCTEKPPEPDVRAFCTARRQIFDADKIGGALRIRARTKGDRFAPLGMKGTRKLSDYLIDRGVPATRRGLIPLVIAGDCIVWVVGHAPAARAAVSTRTRRFLVVEASEAVPESVDELE